MTKPTEPKPPRRTVNISFWATPDEARLIRAAADKERIRVSDFARATILKRVDATMGPEAKAA